VALEQAQIEEAAAFLLHLRVQRQSTSGLPFEIAPKSLDDAYAIQDQLLDAGGWDIGVLKVGCTSEIAQQTLEIPHPIGGRVTADGVFESGQSISASFFAAPPRIECEFALKVNKAGTIATIAPAMELIDSRVGGTGIAVVADNSAAAAVVLGEPLAIEDVDLDDVAVELRTHGEVIATGSAAAVLGGPAASVDWVLEHEKSRGRDPQTIWVITGTCTGLTPTEVGNTYTADFGALGDVSFTLAS